MDTIVKLLVPVSEKYGDFGVVAVIWIVMTLFCFFVFVPLSFAIGKPQWKKEGDRNGDLSVIELMRENLDRCILYSLIWPFTFAVFFAMIFTKH